jgi:RimJ/RimL family protein N-acetyltransferase
MSHLPDVRIRPAMPEDAQVLIDYVKELSEEPGIYLILGPGEFKLTVEEERQYIEEISRVDNSVMYLAFSGAELIGEINLIGGARKAVHHTALLGISVRRGWRGRGVGNHLFRAVLDWAISGRVLRRIELSVFVVNEPAIRLYEKFGFTKEGRRRRSIFRDGIYHDDWMMALLLDDN